MEKKTKQYRDRSRMFKAFGYISTGIGTIGGFLVYQSITNWENFQNQLNDFIIVSQQDVKLNMVIALPVLLSIIIFNWIVLRKNREFFKDKVSLSLLTLIAVLYLMYSVIEITLATLIGAFLGSIVDEFVFTPFANQNQQLYLDNKDIDVEYDKEMKRIKAREKVKEDLNGSV
jgi:L-cystine uptake protein TcyP (sodium:dicarboxylate symporter family)